MLNKNRAFQKKKLIKFIKYINYPLILTRNRRKEININEKIEDLNFKKEYSHKVFLSRTLFTLRSAVP